MKRGKNNTLDTIRGKYAYSAKWKIKRTLLWVIKIVIFSSFEAMKRHILRKAVEIAIKLKCDLKFGGVWNKCSYSFVFLSILKKWKRNYVYVSMYFRLIYLHLCNARSHNHAVEMPCYYHIKQSSPFHPWRRYCSLASATFVWASESRRELQWQGPHTRGYRSRSSSRNLRESQTRWTQRDTHQDIFKMVKVKEMILKTAREKQRATYKVTLIRL